MSDRKDLMVIENDESVQVCRSDQIVIITVNDDIKQQIMTVPKIWERIVESEFKSFKRESERSDETT